MPARCIRSGKHFQRSFWFHLLSPAYHGSRFAALPDFMLSAQQIRHAVLSKDFAILCRPCPHTPGPDIVNIKMNTCLKGEVPRKKSATDLEYRKKREKN